MNSPRYSFKSLLTFGEELLSTAGVSKDQASVIAHILIEADMMGHVTHGLNLLSSYLQDLETGSLRKEGNETVICDHGASVVWDGNRLSGIYLTWKALEEASKRVQNIPAVTFCIRNSHHIGCLAAYMPRMVEQELFCLLASSDPSGKMVAPYGGKEAVYTPNPIAAGIPAGRGGPIIIDISTSVTAAGVVNRHKARGKKLPAPWLLDKEGKPSDDPAIFGGNGSGTILPLGGLDAGYKGYALGLLVEALTSGLAGWGRTSGPTQWGANVFIQVWNPDFFSGKKAFQKEMGWLAEQCRNTSPRSGFDRVRVPGDRALELRSQMLQEGVVLDEGILPTLKPWAEKWNISLPLPLPL